MNKILEAKTFHILILVLGIAFILIGAFHSEVWFDEASEWNRSRVCKKPISRQHYYFI